MKTVSLILLLILFRAASYAQTTQYDTCRHLHQFEGEWWSVSGTDTIKVFLKAARMWSVQLDALEDRLIGWHEYKHGSTVVESDYAHIRTIFPSVDTITGYSIGFWMLPDSCLSTNHTITGSIRDYIQADERHNVRIIINSAGTVMTWYQDFREWHGAFTHAYGMTLPKQFVLTKR